jgi:excisionase family DNA binding protein
MQDVTMTAAGNGHIIADWASMPEWITTVEAAQVSGYDVQYVRELARAGRIGAEKKGRDWWIDRDKLKEYLETMDALGPKKFDPRGAFQGNE